MAAEVKLKPGWLREDIKKAAERASKSVVKESSTPTDSKNAGHEHPRKEKNS
jgi:hypothetical protein